MLQDTIGLSRRMRLIHAIAVAFAFLSPARLAAAHEFWLMPSTYRPASGVTFEVSAWVGAGFRGESTLWSPARAVGFNVIDPEARSLARDAVDADATWARIAAVRDGGHLVSYVSTFSTIEIPAATFDHYLEVEGLREALEERKREGRAAGPGRERYRRCPKLWVGEGGASWSRTVGQPLEIVPLSDPARPGPLGVRVLADGEPAAGRLVRAWRQPLRPGAIPQSPGARDSVGVSCEAWTDARGEARLDLKGRGEFLLAVVRMVRSVSPAAEWESSWASLSFARP